jgi:hypothetical protein
MSLMQPFIAEAIRVITEQLTAPSDLPDEEDSPSPAAELVLDTSVASVVGNGSVIFPSPGGDSEPDWCVLSANAVGGSTDSSVFTFRGRLRAGLKAGDFTAKAYELILLRTIDADGEKIYPDLLDTYQLTKFEFLKILAESPEAQALSHRVLVIPEPSSWLANLSVAPGEDSLFPPLVVQFKQQSPR